MRSAAVLLAFTSLLALPAASAAPAHLPDHDRRQLADLSQRYLQHRADKVTNGPQISGFGVPTTAALATRLRADEIKLEARRIRYRTHPGLGYSRAQTRTSLKRVAVAADGSVVAHVQEVTELYFQDGRSSVDHSTYGMGHVLIFDRTAAGWVLATATRPPGTKCGLPPETQFCGHWSER
jgi:hypothetical protein